MAAFFFFSQEKRAEVQEVIQEIEQIIKSAPRGPGKPKAVSAPKMLRQMWNDMTPSQKKPYKDQAKKAKEEYYAEDSD